MVQTGSLMVGSAHASLIRLACKCCAASRVTGCTSGDHRFSTSTVAYQCTDCYVKTFAIKDCLRPVPRDISCVILQTPQLVDACDNPANTRCRRRCEWNFVVGENLADLTGVSTRRHGGRPFGANGCTRVSWTTWFLVPRL